MRFFFEPSDFLFFRDNKPFTGGESFAGYSLDLPLPQVIYGAARTWLLQQVGVDFKRFAAFTTLDEAAKVYPITRATGLPHVAGSLQIRGPFLATHQSAAESVSLYYPSPLDVVKFDKPKGRAKNLYTILNPTLDQPGQTNLPAAYLQPLMLKPEVSQSGREAEDLEGMLFSERAMGEYLNITLETRQKNEGQILSIEELVQREERIGIAIGENGVVKTGQLYSLEGRRMVEGAGLVVDITGLADEVLAELDGQALHLGGERRFGRLIQIKSEADTDNSPSPPSDLSNKFKLALITPALFKHGWLPGWLDPDTGQGHLPGTSLKVRLVAAAVGRPIVFSGFDLARNRPKPLRRAVPAGSVYYFELLAGNPGQLVKSFHYANSVSDENGLAGFGTTLIGKW
jgi:CRISPR-associated protein Cmr3